ncbi:MAG: response regulator transcription factor [Peptococcaceae bacterium]|jgi:two-component system response regulator ResD|nr:response regulator transcription factor [Peptococcaceae bacterium]
MPKARILIVDDEDKIRELLRLYLEDRGFDTVEACDGKNALREMGRGGIDVIILDLMMPNMDGWEVCREIRSTSRVPIIILTARGGEMDRVLGLDLGADDYVVKPFSLREMVARVNALLRRTAPGLEGQVLRFSGLVIDPFARTVHLRDHDIHLTPKEFDLLYYLACSPGHIFSRDKIMETIWEYDYLGESRAVDTCVNRLREKLRVPGYDFSCCVVTERGIGYKLEAPRED